MIWATVSSRSCFCWLYRGSPSSAAKNIVNLISFFTYLMMSMCRVVLCCWKRSFAMTNVFSWQNSVSLCHGSSGTPIMWILMQLMFSQRSLRISSFLFILYSVLCHWFPPFCLSSHICSSALVLLLMIPSSVFFISVIELLLYCLFFSSSKPLLNIYFLINYFNWRIITLKYIFYLI